MFAQIAFFEIPAADFDRAANFYRNVFEFNITDCDCGDEKMGMFDTESVPGCIFKASGYKPSHDGVLISFEVDDINPILEKVKFFGGKVVMEKTKIEAENMGYCSYFIDSEGNKIGLHSK